MCFIFFYFFVFVFCFNVHKRVGVVICLFVCLNQSYHWFMEFFLNFISNQSHLHTHPLIFSFHTLSSLKSKHTDNFFFLIAMEKRMDCCSKNFNQKFSTNPKKNEKEKAQFHMVTSNEELLQTYSEILIFFSEKKMFYAIIKLAKPLFRFFLLIFFLILFHLIPDSVKKNSEC